jgi:hypothetical protein
MTGSLPPAAGAGTGDSNPYQVLAAAINAQVELIYHIQITLVQFPGQGNFPWYYENFNQVFNNGTFGYVSARVSPGDDGSGLAKLSGPGGYPNAYAQLLGQTEYCVSLAATATGGPGAARLAFDGNQVLRALRQATSQPTATNGGMPTVDPVTGAVSDGCQVGYSVSSPIATIADTLSSGQPVLTVRIPAAAGVTATLSYPGCQLVAVQPEAWQQDLNVGWHDTDPLAQAYRNGQQDVTGYRFTSEPAYNLGALAAGGSFGRLIALLISNPPVTTFSKVNPVARTNPVTPQVVANFYESLSLLNLDQPSGRAQLAPAGLRPAGSDPTVPQLQQTAYVVGASLDFISQD